MKVTADEQRRVTLPEAVRPGDTFDLRQEAEDRFTLVRSSERPARARIVKRGEQFLLASDQPMTLAQTFKALEDFP